MHTIAVSGARGFLAKHLIQSLEKSFPKSKILALDRESLDLFNKKAITDFLEKNKPDLFFNLVGKLGTADLDLLYESNVLPTKNLLEAAAALKSKTRFIIPGSAAEYGEVNTNNLPVTESSSVAPINPYGVSKAWQTTLALYHARSGLDVIVARIFNIIAKDAPTNSAVGSFLEQIHSIKSKKSEPVIAVKSLSGKRDFLYVSDCCEALIALAEKGKRGEIYNICSGQMVLMRELLEKMLKSASVTAKIVETVPPEFAEISDSCGSNKKLSADTGWIQKISFDAGLNKIF